MYIDPAQLRAVAPRFDAIADRAVAALRSLEGALTAEGEFWGNDETGHNFTQMYVGRAEKCATDAAAAPALFEEIAYKLRFVADTTEQTDEGFGSSLNGVF